MDADVAQLEATDQIGPVMAQISQLFPRTNNRSVIESLLKAGVKPTSPPKSSVVLEGLTFVITGTLSRPRSVEQIIKPRRQVGALATPKTSYVIAGEKPGSNRTRPAVPGIKVLTKGIFRY